MSVTTIQSIPTTPFSDQRPGTSGLRKKTRVFMQPHYLENFVQAIFATLRDEAGVDLRHETLVIGGDGRYYNRTAIQRIVRLAAANGVDHLLVGRAGLLSTPAMSAIIRHRGALGGLLLTASHNPGGLEADYGIKYNIRNGGPAPEYFTERIYRHTLTLTHYDTLDHPDLDLDCEGQHWVHNTRVTIIDPLVDYTLLLESLFDFAALQKLFQSGFQMLFDAMHGVTGPYARAIIEHRLGAAEGTVLHGVPQEDFGGQAPDPNLVHAADLVARLDAAEGPDFGAACDGDGDRNLILGPQCFVSPGDSLAIIAEHAPQCIPGYSAGLTGVARSMPTSTAVDRVAARSGIPCYETPTGWKFFGILDAGLCTLCGEEVFGTGSTDCVRRMGYGLCCAGSVLATTGLTVPRVRQNHWRRYGRSYFQRHDYEGLDVTTATAMLDTLREKLPGLVGLSMDGRRITCADDFSYTDPVDGSTSTRGSVLFFMMVRDGSANSEALVQKALLCVSVTVDVISTIVDSRPLRSCCRPSSAPRWRRWNSYAADVSRLH